MNIKLRVNGVVVFIKLKRGGIFWMKNRGKSNGQACSAKCSQHKPNAKVEAKPMIKYNSLGIPVIGGGGKSMRSEYLECR